MRGSVVFPQCSVLVCSVGALALSASHGAFAAQGETDAKSQPVTLEEVVVTAEKRAVDLQDVAASISAISGSTMEDLGLKNLRDYAQYVPGLEITQAGSPGHTTVTLRGMAPIGQGSMVGAYIDDTPMGSSGNFAKATQFALDLLPYDLERLEVLRGPQGTLYGAGSMGGLIKYVLKQADPTRFSAQAGTELSHIDHSNGAGYAVRGAVNLPIIQDQLAIRLSGFDQQDQGYVNNTRLGLEGINGVEQYGGRAATTWKPTDNLSINLNAIWYRLRSDGNNSVRLGDVRSYTDGGGALVYSGTPTQGDFSQNYAFREPFAQDIDYYSGTINWDLGGLTAISATSWSKSTTAEQRDMTDAYGAFPTMVGLPAGVSVFELGLGLQKFTQEFRLVSPTGGPVEWLAGAYYTRESSTNHQQIRVYDADYRPISGPAEAFFNPYFLDVQLPGVYKEYAAFGDLTVHLTPKFDVTGGLRYAHNSQHVAQISDAVILGGYSNFPGESSEGVVTWQVNTRYHFTDDVMAYVRVATGYRAGGPNASLDGVPAKPVDSDTLINYEAGIKSTFLDGRAQLNLSIFDVEWEGIQLNVVDPSTGVGNVANGGDAYSRGFELEGAILPVEGLRLGYTAAYTKAELTRLLPGAPAFLLGYQLPLVPEWSGGVTVDYDWALAADWRASVGAGWRYVGATWDFPVSSPDYIPNTRSPAYATGSLRAGISNDRYSINFYVRNLTDKRVYLYRSPQTDANTGEVYAIDGYMLQPRTVGLFIDVKF